MWHPLSIVYPVDIHFGTTVCTIHRACQWVAFSPSIWIPSHIASDSLHIVKGFLTYDGFLRILKYRPVILGYIMAFLNLTCFRGKLQISQHLRKNMIAKDHFYVSYEAFTLNRPENRLIKAALQKLLKISTSDKNRKEARRLLLFFDEITASADYKQDFSKIQSDRNSRDYVCILPWTDAILQNKGLLQFSEGFEAASILFAMEEVFENYVANQIKKHFQDVWDVSAQDKIQTLFDHTKGFPYSEKLYFRLRPDIVMRHRSQSRTVVLDTKWKQVPQKLYDYPNFAREDMYQMYAYAGRFQVSDIVLLYPKTEHSGRYVNYNCLRTAAYGHSTTIHLFFIDLTDMGKSMMQLEHLLNTEVTE